MKSEDQRGMIFKNRSRVSSSLQKETTITVMQSMLMSNDVNKFSTLSFNSALYRSAIAIPINEEI